MFACGLGFAIAGCTQEAREAGARADCPPSAASLVPKGGWASAPPQAEDHGFLWRIDRDGRTSWLYGTTHIARPEWMRPGPRTREALRQSDAIALEVDIDTDPTARRMQAGKPADTTDKGGVELFNAAQRERFARLVARSCLPAQEKSKTDPASLVRQVLLLNLASTQADGLYAEFGVDWYLFGHARETGMPLVGLESGADQLSAVGNDRGKSPSEKIDETLDKLESGRWRTLAVATADVWARGDLDRLAHYADWCDCLRTPEEQARHERMTAGRNVGMARNIERLHAEGRRVFAAVGALHMVGDKGLPALLAQRGFKVTRVAFAAPS